jgi:hypothetical protein
LAVLCIGLTAFPSYAFAGTDAIGNAGGAVETTTNAGMANGDMNSSINSANQAANAAGNATNQFASASKNCPSSKDVNANSKSKALNDAFWCHYPKNGMYADDQTCDDDCTQVFNQVDTDCNTDSPTYNLTQCNSDKNAQIYSYCQAYNQAGWTAFFDSYMLPLDTGTATACWWAAIQPENAGADMACNSLGLADSVADFAQGGILNEIMGDSFWGTSTGAIVMSALGAFGVAAGVASTIGSGFHLRK